MDPDEDADLDEIMAEYRDDRVDVLSDLALDAALLGGMMAFAMMGKTVDEPTLAASATVWAEDYRSVLVNRGGSYINGQFVPWMENADKETRSRVAEIIDTAVRDGSSKADVTRQLSDYFDTHSHAAMVADTEISRLQNEFGLDTYESEGTHFVQVSDGGGPNACDICEALNGEVWTVEEARSRVLEHPGCWRTFYPVEARDVMRPAVIEPEPDPEPEWSEESSAFVTRLKEDKAFFEDMDSLKRTEQGDMLLGSVLEERGWLGNPKVVDTQTMDGLVSSGYREMYRGISSDKYAEEFRSGKCYIGYGVYGNGTYTAYGQEGYQTAVSFATGEEKGAILRLTLRQDTKVVLHEELVRLQKTVTSEVEDKMDSVMDQVLTTMRAARKSESEAEKKRYGEIASGLKEEYARLQRTKEIYDDPSRLAAIRGYEAIDIQDRGYMIVLNRQAVIVQGEGVKF